MVAAYGLADTVDKGRKAYVYSLPSSFGGASGSSYGGSAVPGGPPVALSGSARGMARSVADAVCLAQQAASQRQLAGSAREQQSLAVPVAAAVLDSAVFHGVASLAIPAVMINRCGSNGFRPSLLLVLSSLFGRKEGVHIHHQTRAKGQGDGELRTAASFSFVGSRPATSQRLSQV